VCRYSHHAETADRLSPSRPLCKAKQWPDSLPYLTPPDYQKCNVILVWGIHLWWAKDAHERGQHVVIVETMVETSRWAGGRCVLMRSLHAAKAPSETCFKPVLPTVYSKLHAHSRLGCCGQKEGIAKLRPRMSCLVGARLVWREQAPWEVDEPGSSAMGPGARVNK
jgi:hypothetical protein